jgi:two-component system, chemotaxis family, sensor kinase CheA
MDEAKKEKYLKIFRAEAEDLLKKIRDGLLALESNTQDAETFNVILRAAHTLKGSARMVGLEEVGKLAHKMEDLLKAVESGKQKMSETVASLLFNGIELVEKMMASPPSFEGSQLDGLIEKIAAAAEGKKVSKPAAESSLKVEEVSEEKLVPMETLRVEAARLDKMINFTSQLVLDRIRFESNMYKFKKGVDDLDDLIKANQEVLRNDFPALAKQMDEISHRFREFYQTHYEDVIELEHDVQETHFQALFLRMFPISILFEEFPFYLRDLAKELGKRIELRLEGGESELDKRVLEELRGPMVHLLRNACDHGVETPEERKKAGKPESGKIAIKAYPKGNQIVIEISDDGKGMDLEQIRRKAVEKGFFAEKEAESIGENELLQLIFQPGFSTSKIVTAVSGRGVGMDVVKTAIERLGGDIAIETEKGKGSLIRLQVPFTLGILRCVLIMIDDVVYAFPTHSLEGSLRVALDHIQTDRGQPLLSFRQEMVPVYYLGDLLGFEQKQGWPQRDGHLSLLIISHSQQRMAVVVDKILREDEVVTKSFGYPLAGAVKFVSGSTLLRAGEIGLIINIFDLFDEVRGRHLKPQMMVAPAAAAAAKKKIQVLVVDDSLTSRIVERNLLEQAGYEVELAESAEQALEKVETKNYDIFLVDVEMPGLNGFELTRRLKSDARTKRTPVVIVSTRSTEEDKRQGIDAGAQGYVIKSKLEPVEFIKLIKHLVGE